ncbi:methyltransferase family protein [Pseudoruegeria sp. SHC-113]|uniref:methyltransferase family protein n=1 Tax=Pseudoruegeria sp. SHC-113 TaxID=2855439 RepID=UPI0021BA57C9|nr:isoprenylcysteine carboxylmethyltransferase family protein [Pseudoruegeria sp. SHC-113]MCT8161148.1 isoprenylcysteine carboxylmethyltransferase family protein [Pseudoruegeria sp. SHC-113]
MARAPQDRPAIRLYPPALSVATPCAAILLEWLAPLGWLPGWPSLFTALGLALMALAGWLAMRAGRAFATVKTNIDPRSPATAIAETGPYRFTRNPMYLGMVFLQIGLGLAFSLEWALPLAALLWLALDLAVVRPEEAYLSAKFPESYPAYRRRVRRWI